MPDRTLHLICNAHLDPVWLWEWPEGAAEAISTFRTAADLCEQYDAFVFNHNEAVLYEWVEQYDPELFERIRRLVADGRWHIMGGWYLQPDCNMPAGETFVRVIRLGREYFRDRFGAEPRTATNFDPFGHTRGLVQIFARSGYDSYIFCRPDPADIELPAEQFTWVGYDGSEVAAARVHSYKSLLGQARGKIERELASSDEPCGLLLWGVGNHGGGPSRKDLAEITELIAERDDVRIVHSTPEEYFAELRSVAELPKHAGDLNPWAVGCYTSQVRIKQAFRELESALYSAEKMAAAAWRAGQMDYPHERLRQAERDLAFSTFHDILPGSSIRPAEEASLRRMHHGREILDRVRGEAFFALAAGQRPATEGEIPVFAYNPHPYPVDATIECEFNLPDQNWGDDWTLLRARRNGRAVPTQVEKEQSNIDLDWRKRVVIRARLAASQMSRFDCRMERVPDKPEPKLKARRGKLRFANERLEFVVNAETGLVDRWRVDGADCCAAGAFEPVVLEDDWDPWGSRIRRFGKVAGRFALASKCAAAKFSAGDADTPAVRVVEQGPVRTVIEAIFVYRDSRICQRYKLPADGTAVEIELEMLWCERDRLVKLAVPLGDGTWRHVGQVAYGVEDLPADGDEAVAQKWTALVSDGRDLALSCIRDGGYGSDVRDGVWRMTLLRSPAYSALPLGNQPRIDRSRYLPRIDVGQRRFRFVFDAGRPRDRLGRIDREALAWNEKPYVLSFYPTGRAGGAGQLVTLSDGTVQATAVKKAERGDALIVRLHEPTGRVRTTTLSLPGEGVKTRIRLAGFEVRTVRIDLDDGTVSECDLLERPIG